MTLSRHQLTRTCIKNACPQTSSQTSGKERYRPPIIVADIWGCASHNREGPRVPAGLRITLKRKVGLKQEGKEEKGKFYFEYNISRIHRKVVLV